LFIHVEQFAVTREMAPHTRDPGILLQDLPILYVFQMLRHIDLGFRAQNDAIKRSDKVITVPTLRSFLSRISRHHNPPSPSWFDRIPLSI
jgi:hypothetical protein